MRKLPALFALSLLFAATPVLADPPCGAVEVRFKPGAWNLQVVIWVEDGKGAVIDTPYITRATGQFGIANRPGAALLKTDCGWPYGRREMVLPVWAHRRNHHYPKVVMGGACGNSVESLCPNGTACQGNCDDTTIAYHSSVSSAEPYFCAPEGCVPGHDPDVVSCASPIRTLSKGAYADPSMQIVWSLYPPRGDVTKVDPQIDSLDVVDFARRNDLVAVSQATPRPGQALDSPIFWNPQNLAEGDYVAYVEVSQEADFNAFHRHANQDDSVILWNGQGHAFLGQPSMVYRVPLHYDAQGGVTSTDGYAGYGSWDGQSGDLNPPDGTITVGTDGSGEGRLVKMPDGHRVEVLVGSCSAEMGDGGLPHMDCPAPAAPEGVRTAVNKAGTAFDVTFQVPSSGAAANRYDVRYWPTVNPPISDDNFDSRIEGRMLGATRPGDTLKVTITNITPSSSYQVGVRGIAACGTPSPVAVATLETGSRNFARLNGCFVATAAFGSPLEREVGRLRAFRDRRLLGNAAGQLFVAAYYAFGPSLAEAIAPDGRRRALARALLEPMVKAIDPLL